MKVAVFGPSRRVGIVQDDTVVDINRAYAKYLAETSNITRVQAHADTDVPAQLVSFIEEGPRALDGAREALDYLATEAQDGRDPDGARLRYQLDEVTLHPPVALESQIFCALANFADHMESAARNAEGQSNATEVLNRLLTSGPKHFLKHTRCAVGDHAQVRYPARTQRFDYEAEVAVVIGKRGRDINSEDFAPYIWGYTLLNDWSVRDYGLPGADFPYTKNFDTAATIGPWIVVDEGIDPQDIPIELRLNGELRQRGNTSSMVHSFAAMAQHASADMTLYPGDLISSGTPMGTAIDSTPRRPDGTHDEALFVKPGDVVEVSSELIGTIRNEVVKPTE